MNYQFPVIRNISDVLPAIEGRSEFVVAVKDGYTVINYNVMFDDTFPSIDYAAGNPCDWHFAVMRRECRGIIFDTATGDIIRRPFHKFFNVNERPETQDVPLYEDHSILEKLDGSMIAPFIVNGQMIWGTKMGATDVAKPVEEFVNSKPRYTVLAAYLISQGYSPIFEWCSRKQRIVLDYKKDQLILTAVRHMQTGEYFVHESLVHLGELYTIPVVRAFDPQTDMKAFIEYTRDLKDLEGFVVRFDNGHMVKLKCDWYVQIHKAKERILQDRHIVELILDQKLDDVKPHLPIEDRDRLTRFESNFWTAVARRVLMVAKKLQYLNSNGVDRKAFALYEKHSVDGYMRPIIFKNFDSDIDCQKLDADVINTIRKNLTRTSKYEEIRAAWFPGVIYNA